MKRKITLLLCSAAFAACLMTGCGGDDDKSGSNTDVNASEEQSDGSAADSEESAGEEGADDSQDDYSFEEQEVFE